MFARNTWYMAGWSHELERYPLARRLLGEDVVLFRDASGVAHALNAMCPHRGANLARGELIDSTLECPLHGWRFAGDGRCTRIPSQPGDHPIPAATRAVSYPIREQQGILWIWMGEGDEPVTRPPWQSFWEPESGQRRTFQPVQRIDAPFVSVVENALDNAHLAFVHRRTLPRQPEIISRQTVTVDEDGSGFWGEDDPESPWGPAPSERVGSLAAVVMWLFGFRSAAEYQYRYELPGLVFHRTVYANGTWDIVLANATPIDERQTWFFAEVVRTRATSPLAEMAQRFFNRRLSSEDAIAARALLAKDAGGRPRPVHVAADEAALKFRSLYARFAASEGGKAAWDEGVGTGEEKDLES